MTKVRGIMGVGIKVRVGVRVGGGETREGIGMRETRGEGGDEEKFCLVSESRLV